MTGFFLTWSERGWPYAHLRALVDQFDRSSGHVDVLWRVTANRLAKPGDIGFLLKQGGENRGIFGYGRILTRSFLQTDPTSPELRKRATLRIERLVDPLVEGPIVSLSELESVVETWRINAQSSGSSPLDHESEQWLVKRLGVAASAYDDQGLQEIKSSVRGPSLGPAPVNWTGESSRSMDNEAVTYAMQYGNRNIWKIGFTNNIYARVDEVNRHIPTEIIDEAWEVVFIQRWSDGERAYHMEQNILEALSKRRTVGERVRCDRDELRRAWESAVAKSWLKKAK